MPGTFKTLSAHEHRDVSRTLPEHDDEAIARFLDHVNYMLTAVVAALILCLAYIVSSRPAEAATRVQRMQKAGMETIERGVPCRPGPSITATRGSAITAT
jgi:hypothetical protein